MLITPKRKTPVNHATYFRSCATIFLLKANTFVMINSPKNKINGEKFKINSFNSLKQKIMSETQKNPEAKVNQTGQPKTPNTEQAQKENKTTEVTSE